MDHLFTPWRYAFVTTVDKTPGCFLCDKPKETDDRANHIVHRGQHCFIVLNTFPYTSGHVLVSPYEHVDRFDRLNDAAVQEMTRLAQRMETVLRELYAPDGINMGMNIGKAAGAGVAGHIHLHVLPRWFADSNFMSVTGETRVLPEALESTWDRISGKLR